MLDRLESMHLIFIDCYMCENRYSIYFVKISINHIINTDNEYYLEVKILQMQKKSVTVNCIYNFYICLQIGQGWMLCLGDSIFFNESVLQNKIM